MSKSVFPYERKNSSSLGLTTREYFAACAMQGILADQAQNSQNTATVALKAVEYADALIAALNKASTSEDEDGNLEAETVSGPVTFDDD